MSSYFDGHEYQSNTGYSFEDYQAARTITRKVGQQRRKPDPLWAFDDRLLRELICKFYERKLQTLQNIVPPLVSAVLIELCRNYSIPGLGQSMMCFYGLFTRIRNHRA